MRVLYLVLLFFILLNIGAVCRTPSTAIPEHCEAVASGLLHCPPNGMQHDG